jgi:dynein heavy chain
MLFVAICYPSKTIMIGVYVLSSLLVVAGMFKRADPEVPEQALLMRALRDFNQPRIVAEDWPIFMGLITDLFPNLEALRKRDMDFEAIIEQKTVEEKLWPDPEFIKKVV